MDEDWISAVGTLVVLLGIAMLLLFLTALYCFAVVWALNYLFKWNIGQYDLWAWLAVLILSFMLHGNGIRVTK